MSTSRTIIVATTRNRTLNTLVLVLPHAYSLAHSNAPHAYMPALAFARRLLGRSKGGMVTSSSSFWCMDANPQAIEPPVPQVLPENVRAELISLVEAQNNPDIVYRSVNVPLDLQAAIVESYVAETLTVPLVPLAVAASRDDIKYRREGFEM